LHTLFLVNRRIFRVFRDLLRHFVLLLQASDQRYITLIAGYAETPFERGNLLLALHYFVFLSFISLKAKQSFSDESPMLEFFGLRLDGRYRNDDDVDEQV